MFPQSQVTAARLRSRWIFLPAILCFLFSELSLAAAVIDLTPQAPRNERELIVKFRNGATVQEKSRVLRNASSVKQVPMRRGLRAAGNQPGAPGTVTRIQVAQGTEMDAELARLQSNPAVEYAEPNYSIQLFAITNVLPNDFEFEKMYSLQNRGGENAKTNADVSAPAAWAFTTGSKSVVVAVIDTGIDYLHDDLKENLWNNPREIPFNGIDEDGNGFIDDVYGYDFVSNDSDPFDDNQHGTHVAGTIGAKGNNGIGTVGVCWEVSLMALKAFDEKGNGTVADAIAAMTYAVENGARVINASWGLEERSRALEEATKVVADAGVLMIAAAGNSRTDAPSYPASFETVLSVAATDAKDARADFSNYGSFVDVAAPGANILSTLPENSYGLLSGTSMAAPHVAGMAALVLARFPMYSRQELFDILINSVDAMSFDLPIGNGRINLSRAVQMDQPLPTARVSVAGTASGFVDVTGTAAGTFFSGYSLNIGSGRSPINWIQITSSSTAVTDKFLGRFDSAIVPDGPAVVQLVVSNLNGAAAIATAPLTIFNGMITSPLSADVLAPKKYVVRGTVHGDGKSYDLFYGAGISPTSWTKIAAGSAGKIDAPLGEWDASALGSGFYALKLKITDHDKSSEFTAPLIYIEPKLKPGWPAHVGTDADFPSTEWRNVRPADLDGDGLSEFVLVDAGTRGRKQTLRVFSLSGQELWSRELGYDIPPDFPAIGDVNGDGRKEIFVDGTNGLVAFRHDGTILQGWPVQTETSNHAKVLADVDGDGAPELISYSQEYAATQVAETRELSVFKADGTLIRKWTLPWCGFTNDVQKIFPTVANLDDDAALEIVVPSGCSELFAFDLENTEPKWRAPVTGKILSSPVAGDVDGNGAVDIVLAVAAVNPGSAAGVYVFDRFGQRWIGWPVLEEFSFATAPALGDLDQDGRLEILVVEDAIGALMHVLESDGFHAEGWPQRLFQNTSSRVGVSIADINNDDLPEIITSVPGYVGLTLTLGENPDYIGGIVARDRFGKIVSLNGTSLVKSMPFESAASARFHKAAPVAIGDLDGNGRLDLVFSSIQERTYGSLRVLKQRSSLYAWELPGGGTVEWPMFGHDVANSGAYSLPLSPAPVPSDVTRAMRDRVMTLEDRELQIYATTNDWNATAAPLTIISFTAPTNGAVTVNGSVLNYRPNPDFSGFDSFSYTVRDANGTTSSAPVIVRVKPVNDPPVAKALSLTMNKNSSVDVFYDATDPEETSFTFRIIDPPKHGELWNYPAVGTYYPTPGYSGTDSFSYVANDGKSESLPAVVSITILNSNNPPKAVSQNLLTKTNRSLLITPGGTDLDGDPLTFEIVTQPQVGTATQEGTQFRFTPPQNYVGQASFSFRAFDGTAASADAIINIGIIATNASPRARDGNATVQPNSESTLRLTGSDPDGDLISFEVLTEPLHGQLSGTPPDLTYRPRKDYLGPDRFEFRVTDGFATSAAASFNIQVVRQNRPPKAVDQSISAELNLPASFALNASDPDEDPIRVIILKGPRNGVLYGSGTNLTYAPKSGTVSFDSFTYKLWDGQRFGNVARVSLNLFEPGEERPPAFTSIRTVNGIVQLSLSVTEGVPFRVETSANLKDWSILLPSTIVNAPTFHFQDTNPPVKMRYYRAVSE